MKKISFQIFGFIVLTCLIISLVGLWFLETDCNNDEKVEGFKPHQIIVVTLEIEDNIDIEQIILISTEGTDTIIGSQIDNKKKIKLKNPQFGEGLFSICVYTPTDTLCSQESYIEGGYRPKLKLKNNVFETIEWH
ncbi:MAG: hypothetical protein FWC39_12805 [Bacteroidetes bacterium]|nr:hypothetical protein [Bacteroidota bacterium]